MPAQPLHGLAIPAAGVPSTLPLNAFARPAIPAPLLWTSRRLPVGVHLVGRYGNEAALFRLPAQQLP